MKKTEKRRNADDAAMSGQTAPCLMLDYGELSMAESLELMKTRHSEIMSGGTECLMFFRSKPALCAGRGFKSEHLRAGDRQFLDHGVEFHHVNRGGSVTVHGPGQLVVYVLLRLDRYHRDIHVFLRKLEQVGIETAAFFGVEGRRVSGKTGVWTDEGKLMAIGIGAKNWITLHGVCMNLEPDPALFDMIIPCGLDDRRQAGLCALAGKKISYSQAVSATASVMARVFQLELETGMNES